MIDLSTGWFEIVQQNDKHDVKIANLVEQIWLCRYPCPTIIMYLWGNEFLGHVFNKYLIKQNMQLKPSV